MLVKFTIDAGLVPIRDQAREDILTDRLRILREFDPSAEEKARKSIQDYLATHTEFTAAHIACTGNADEWHPEFEALYLALESQFSNPREAHEEAGKFLGVLVWNEALKDKEEWHFTKYPKLDSDLMVTHYFAVDGHIRSQAKLEQAATAREHGDENRATKFEDAARALKAKWSGQ
jgi:hypothetical protein